MSKYPKGGCGFVSYCGWLSKKGCLGRSLGFNILALIVFYALIGMGNRMILCFFNLSLLHLVS